MLWRKAWTASPVCRGCDSIKKSRAGSACRSTRLFSRRYRWMLRSCVARTRSCRWHDSVFATAIDCSHATSISRLMFWTCCRHLCASVSPMWRTRGGSYSPPLDSDLVDGNACREDGGGGGGIGPASSPLCSSIVVSPQLDRNRISVLFFFDSSHPVLGPTMPPPRTFRAHRKGWGRTKTTCATRCFGSCGVAGGGCCWPSSLRAWLCSSGARKIFMGASCSS